MKFDKKNKNVFLHEGHTYVTRRQLLGAGLIPFSAGMLMPSLWDVLMRNGIAEAAMNCPPISNAGDGLPAIIALNLGGGPAMGQFGVPVGTDNVTPLAAAGQLGLGTSISSYNQVKNYSNNFLVPQSNGTSSVTNLGAFFTAVSGSGTTGVAPLTGTAATNVTVIANACDTGDDTSSDAGYMAGMVAKWITSRKLPTLQDGGPGQVAAFLNPPAPLNVSSVTSVQNAIAPATGALNATLTNKQKQEVFNLVSNLSASQAAVIGANPNSQNFSDLVNCAGTQNVQLAQSGTVAFDPRQDPIMQGIYGITANSSASSNIVVEATVVYCALKGLTPFAQISMGGYDYHGNDAQTVTLPKDATAGAVANRALRAAAALGVDMYFYVQSDGATGADSTTNAGSSPSGDRGSGSAHFLIVHRVSAPAAASRNWINGYTTGDVASTSGAGAFTSTASGSSASMFYNIVHNYTGATTIADNILSGLAGAPTAAQVSSLIVI